MLLLGLMWWSWVGYAWLTSVVNPEEGAIRFAIFAAMAAMLAVALCVPEAFGDSRMLFAVAYAGVRFGQIALFILASRDEPALRASVTGLAGGTAVGCGLLVVGALFDDPNLQAAIWAVALALDMLEPFLFGSEGWLHPGHFAERHGLIIIIALGESIVAIGVGAGTTSTPASSPRPCSGSRWPARSGGSTSTSWPSSPSGAQQRRGRPRAERHRPRPVLHLPDGRRHRSRRPRMKKTLGHVDDPLKTVPAAALGGTAVYLLAHVAFRWRNVHQAQHPAAGGRDPAVRADPVATELDALLTLVLLAVLLCALIVYETVHFADLRDRLRATWG